jgi:predicted DNA-binding transcriptional regulator AlpA
MATEEFKTTRKVALLLGIKPGRLSMALWDRRIPEPKRLGRSCMWTDAALIETRGEGGLFLCAPTPGYTLLQGTFANVPLLTAAERETLIEAARLLGVSRTLFYGLLSAARDPVGLRLGRCRRWSVDELRAWTAAGAPPLSRWSSTRGRL